LAGSQKVSGSSPLSSTPIGRAGVAISFAPVAPGTGGGGLYAMARWRRTATVGVASFAAVFSTCTLALAAEGCRLDLLQWRDADGQQQRASTAEEWAPRRRQILDAVQTVMGPLPRPAKPTSLEPRIVAEDSTRAVTRLKVAYHTDSPRTVVHAWLLIPNAGDASPPSTAKRPAVLCLHQTTAAGKDESAGISGRPSMHYALELAERGYVTLAPDYPSLGEYEYDFESDDYASGSMKAIYDNVRAVDYLQSRPEVDPERIGVIGHSLGGHNAIFTALFEPRIKAVVSSCGFTRFHKYYGGELKGWAGPRYMPRVAEQYGNDPDRMPFDFPELLAALAPRPMLAVAPLEDDNFEVSGVRDSIAAARPVYQLLGAEGKLQAIYPAAGHDFPAEARRQAYEFLDRALRLAAAR
jgi:dienelactone hydrolase